MYGRLLIHTYDPTYNTNKGYKHNHTALSTRLHKADHESGKHTYIQLHNPAYMQDCIKINRMPIRDT